MTETILRPLLLDLAQALEAAGETRCAEAARVAAAAREEERDHYLRSNELWGGAGSVADQAGVGSPRTAERRRIEQALVALGKAQMTLGIDNARTAMWVGAFEQWAERGF